MLKFYANAVTLVLPGQRTFTIWPGTRSAPGLRFERLPFGWNASLGILRLAVGYQRLR